MPKKKTRLGRFSELTWNDIEEWAGGKIVSRGRSYQRQGLVRDLAVTDDGSLIAWVDGTERYATRVVIDEDGLPESTCTCPYYMDCKHGVAAVIEYLNLDLPSRPEWRRCGGLWRAMVMRSPGRTSGKPMITP